jgi:phage RecT family recombinase
MAVQTQSKPVQTQQKQAQPKQDQQTQNPTNTKESNPFRAFFLKQREVVEALVSNNIKRKYPSFVAELIADFARTIFEDKTKEPYNLKNTSSSSMIKAIKYCARKGLSLSQEQVYLGYFKGNLTPMIGLRGYRELIRRNPRILKVGVYVVKQKDEFNLTLGTKPHIHHAPNIFEDSPIIGSYAYAKLRDGGCLPIFCNKKELDEARNKSKSSWTKTLWEDNPESMSNTNLKNF